MIIYSQVDNECICRRRSYPNIQIKIHVPSFPPSIHNCCAISRLPLPIAQRLFFVPRTVLTSRTLAITVSRSILIAQLPTKHARCVLFETRAHLSQIERKKEERSVTPYRDYSVNNYRNSSTNNDDRFCAAENVVATCTSY